MNNQSEEIKELVTALSKAQGSMRPAVFNKVNPHFRNRYADFTSIMDACREPLSNNGLSIMQYCETVNEKLNIVTMLAHASGQWIKSYFPLYPAKLDSQSIGSSITYAKRYCLSAMIGIVSDDDDDDGEASMPKNQTQSKPKQQAPKPEAITKSEPIKSELIEDAQGKELAKLLVKCTQTYQDQVWKHLVDNCSITCYDEMTVKIWENLMDRTKKEIAKKEKESE